MTKLPDDDNKRPIPALRLKQDGAHSISATSSSTSNANAFDQNTKVVSVYATVDVYLNFGDSGISADANDHFYPAGIYYDFSIGEEDARHKYLAVLRAGSTDGTVYISEKE